MVARPLIAGNWKMNGRLGDLDQLEVMAEAERNGIDRHVDMLLCLPATLLHAAKVAAGGVALGGQDCHCAEKGAHTGDISAEMLADAGARYVIVGHSERRADHGESDATVRAKAAAATRAGLVAIVCVGESESEREAGDTLPVLGRQLAGSLPDALKAETTVIAYEPVWAIGTGRTATPADVRDVHAFIRRTLTARFGSSTGASVRLLYGGSVKPSNAAKLLGIENVDGALVGGASLKASDFIAICEAARQG